MDYVEESTRLYFPYHTTCAVGPMTSPGLNEVMETLMSCLDMDSFNTSFHFTACTTPQDKSLFVTFYFKKEIDLGWFMLKFSNLLANV